MAARREHTTNTCFILAEKVEFPRGVPTMGQAKE
jgi:hypothetical protein